MRCILSDHEAIRKNTMGLYRVLELCSSTLIEVLFEVIEASFVWSDIHYIPAGGAWNHLLLAHTRAFLG